MRAAPILLVVGLVTILAGCRRQAPEHESVTARDDAVRIARDRLDDGNAHFFTYRHQGRNVNFFLRTDSQGTIRAHFDACHGCYQYRRGYVQEGGQVVCLACRIGYDLRTPVWDYVGACVPISLKSRIQADEVTVPVAALQKGARYF